MINKFGFYDALEDCFDPSILTYFEANTAGQRVKSRTFSRCALGYGKFPNEGYKIKLIFYGTFRNNSLFSFLGILISKQIGPAFLFSFQLRIKKPFHIIIAEDSLILFAEVKCKENTQSTDTEETNKYHQVIKLLL